MASITDTAEMIESLRRINTLTEERIRKMRRLVSIYDDMAGSVRNARDAVESLSGAMETGFDTSAIRNTREEINQMQSTYEEMRQTVAQGVDVNAYGVSSVSESSEGSSGESVDNNFIDLSGALGALAVIKDFSDEVNETSNRIRNMNGGLEGAKELQSKILQSAQRTGSSFEDIVGYVEEFRSMKDAFGSNNEAIAFNELMNKGMSANGVSGDMQSEIMNQLAQSMSTGTMGVEDIQLMSQYIPELSSGLQEYMNNVKGVKGNLQNMAAQGMISAEDIKNAMFMSSGQIEESFASAPMTFGQRKRFFNI